MVLFAIGKYLPQVSSTDSEPSHSHRTLTGWNIEIWGRKDKIKEAHMQINISLPDPSNTDNTTETRSFLKQLELAVHHAQKSLDEMVKMAKEAGTSQEFTVMYRLSGVEDSGTGDKFDSEHPCANRIEIELYEA